MATVGNAPETSYAGVISAIRQKFESVKQCDTLTGNELMGKAYKQLCESTTPILDLKEFTTNAEKVASDDATLGEVISFCRSKVKTGDLNFLINLCKEEHFKEMNRMYHPAPQETVKAFEEMFIETPTVIEQGIRNGVFDSMKSNLLGVLKNEYVEPKKVRENKIPSNDQTLTDELYESAKRGDLCRYAPIGIRLEDTKKNQIVHLMENTVIRIVDGAAVRLDESEMKELDIPVAHRRLMSAITELRYNPMNESFTPRFGWDFQLEVCDGKATVNSKEISAGDMKQLLLESVQCYEQFPGKVENFDKLSFMRDADNMVILMENFGQLLKYDNIEVIKNLNESSFVMFDKRTTVDGKVPQIIASSNHNGTKLFENFGEMVNECNSILNESIADVFQTQLNEEHTKAVERREKMAKLNEEVAEINGMISKAEQVAKMAEDGSAAKKEMNFRIAQLNESLNQKLDELQKLQ